MPKKIEKPRKRNSSQAEVDSIEQRTVNQIRNEVIDEMDTYLEAIADVEGLGTMIHTTRAWQALHLEVQAEILADVKKHLAVLISNRIKGEVE